MVLISIVVPIYNVEKYLRRCLDSVTNQTLNSFECILVDDGSLDKSIEICYDYISLDKRFRLIGKENGGLTSARFVGFKESVGKYIVFIDSDDYLHPDYLQKLYNSITENNAQVAICSYFLDNGDHSFPISLEIKKRNLEKNDIINLFILPIIGRIQKKGYFNLPGFLWLRMIEKSYITPDCFFSEREYFTEDDLFNLMLAKQINKISFINDPLYYYFQNPLSLTKIYRKNAWDMLVKRYLFCVEYCIEMKIEKEASERLHFSLFQFVSFSIDNICKSEVNTKEKISEIQRIISNSFVIEMMQKINIRLMSISQLILYTLLKSRLFYLIIKYRENRILGEK